MYTSLSYNMESIRLKNGSSQLFDFLTLLSRVKRVYTNNILKTSCLRSHNNGRSGKPIFLYLHFRCFPVTPQRLRTRTITEPP